ncbi:MAG: hypothetical protein PGN13_02525 [Patulibacter minatonensis]
MIAKISASASSAASGVVRRTTNRGHRRVVRAVERLEALRVVAGAGHTLYLTARPAM